jgi:F0F1-type ATP synthase delta subunit
MNKDQIKKLAKITIRNGELDEKVARKVLSLLSRKELIFYLETLKRLAYENSVRVISAQKLSEKEREVIRSKFNTKSVYFERDETLGPGIKIVIDDSIIDLTIKGYINNALEQLKE